MQGKRPVVNYSEFRFSRINEDRFSHLKLLWAWPVYLALYLITEKFIPAESCHIIYCALDDIIPFCEFFVIPYVLWYFYVVGFLIYFGLYDVDSFKKLMKYLIITQLTAMTIYTVFPSRQELRPEFFPRENILTACVAFLYSIDTSTNVCPSLHVAYSLGIASACVKSTALSRPAKTISVCFAALVCISTTFIKQHSFLDFLAALPLWLIAEIIVSGKSKANPWKALN